FRGGPYVDRRLCIACDYGAKRFDQISKISRSALSGCLVCALRETRRGGGEMRLVLFKASEGDDPTPGLLTERGVVGLAAAVARGHTPQLTMQKLIDGFERMRPALERLAVEGEAQPLAAVRLRAPLPRPGKILCCIANYWEHAQREARPLNMFLKNP